MVAEMLDNGGASRHAVIESMLGDVFDWHQHLRIDTELPDSLAEVVAEHGIIVRPDFGFYADETGDGEDDEPEDAEDDEDEDSDGDAPSAEEAGVPAAGRGPWKLLGCYLPWGSHPLARATTGGWTASGIERLAVLLRARDVPVGVVTDGRWWAIVWAPRGGTTGAAVWDASLFPEDPAWLRALVALLSRSRFLAVAPADRPPAPRAASLPRQEEVTETLGRQVRDAGGSLSATLAPRAPRTPGPRPGATEPPG